jgi:hypothetical protein
MRKKCKKSKYELNIEGKFVRKRNVKYHTFRTIFLKTTDRHCKHLQGKSELTDTASIYGRRVKT